MGHGWTRSIPLSLVCSTLLSGVGAAEMALPYEGRVGHGQGAFKIFQEGSGPALEGVNVDPCGPTPPQLPGQSPHGCGFFGSDPYGYNIDAIARFGGGSIGVRGYSSLGYGGWFDSGKDHYDLVLGGAVGRLNSDPNNKDAVLVISSNRDILMRLDNDAGGSGVFRVEDSGGNAVLAVAEDGHLTTKVLDITGGSDLSERFQVDGTAPDPAPGNVVSIDPDNPGLLAVSHEPYDRKVAGIISGAGDVQAGMLLGSGRPAGAGSSVPVALTGRVYCWADASNGPIVPGDLLTTSPRPGHAMRVTDHSKAQGAILGKAMTALKQDQGLVLVLVALQ